MIFQEMKCGAEEENLQLKCPLCTISRDNIHALKYHIKTAHKKNKRGNALSLYTPLLFHTFLYFFLYIFVFFGSFLLN